MAELPRQTLLSVQEAAWLARVNDGTVRTWCKDKIRDRKIAWGDLYDYCSAHRKALPLHPDFLSLSSEDLRPRPGPREGDESEVVTVPKVELDRLERQVERLTALLVERERQHAKQVARLSESLREAAADAAQTGIRWAEISRTHGTPADARELLGGDGA